MEFKVGDRVRIAETKRAGNESTAEYEADRLKYLNKIGVITYQADGVPDYFGIHIGFPDITEPRSFNVTELELVSLYETNKSDD